MNIVKNISLLIVPLLSVLCCTPAYGMEHFAFGIDIFEAVKTRNKARVRELVAANNEIVNQQDIDDNSPLYWATRLGFYDMVDDLIAAGANLEHKDQYGYRPLHWAVMVNQKTMVQALVKAGVNLDEESNNGSTPLKIAQSRKNQSMVDMLADYHSRIQQAKQRAPIIAFALAMGMHSRLGAECPLSQELLRYISKLTTEAECHDARQPSQHP